MNKNVTTHIPNQLTSVLAGVSGSTTALITLRSEWKKKNTYEWTDWITTKRTDSFFIHPINQPTSLSCQLGDESYLFAFGVPTIPQISNLLFFSYQSVEFYRISTKHMYLGPCFMNRCWTKKKKNITCYICLLLPTINWGSGGGFIWVNHRESIQLCNFLFIR